MYEVANMTKDEYEAQLKIRGGGRTQKREKLYRGKLADGTPVSLIYSSPNKVVCSAGTGKAEHQVFQALLNGDDDDAIVKMCVELATEYASGCIEKLRVKGEKDARMKKIVAKSMASSEKKSIEAPCKAGIPKKPSKADTKKIESIENEEPSDNKKIESIENEAPPKTKSEGPTMANATAPEHVLRAMSVRA